MSSRMSRVARRSYCVRPIFIMVIGTPACAATGTMLAAGITSKVEPTTHSSSAVLASRYDFSIAPSGSASPKYTTSVLIMPPHGISPL